MRPIQGVAFPTRPGAESDDACNCWKIKALAARTSVELHPDGCRVVQVDVVTGRRAVPAGDARVTAFVNPVPGGSDTVALTAALTALRQEGKFARDAWVTVWGLRTTQQLLRLPPAKPDALEALARREARKDVAPFETEADGASVSVTPGAEIMVGSHRRREVSLVAASNAEIRARIQPLLDAGFLVRGVVTPALALAAVARPRRTLTPGTAAYVAILGGATCVAIVRDGLLLFAREMPWGHQEPSVETRLASELKRSILFFKQTFRAPVEAVVLCGDMPTLRALTAPLGESLAIPVQVLDSLVGIDAAAVPEPAEQFRADVASLRLAIAVAAEPAPAANLLPAVIRKLRESYVQAVRLGIGLAASILLLAGWFTIVNQTARHQGVEIESIQQQLAILEPDAVRAAQRRDAYTVTVAQQNALSAFDSQGPRLARFLEVLAQATPDEVTLTSLQVQAEGAAWMASITGIAAHENAAQAQAAVNAMLEALAASPFAGPTVSSPSRKIVSGRGADPATTAALPAGMIGVEFAAQIRLAK